LIDDYFANVYKEAGDTMNDLHAIHRAYSRHVLIDQFQLVSNGDGGAEMAVVEYWPIGILEDRIDLANKALEEIAFYKESDPKLYDQIAKNIELEAIQYMYILLDLHGNTIAKEERQAYIDRLKYDLVWLDVSGMAIKGKDLSLADWVNAL
jgi:hypothetical protein